LSQALRLYVYPYFRPMDVDPTSAGAAAGKDGKAKGNAGANSKKARSPSPPKAKQTQGSDTQDSTSKKKSSLLQSSEITSDQQSLAETAQEERQRPALQLQQLNTVIFGLPNLTFTP